MFLYIYNEAPTAPPLKHLCQCCLLFTEIIASLIDAFVNNEEASNENNFPHYVQISVAFHEIEVAPLAVWDYKHYKSELATLCYRVLRASFLHVHAVTSTVSEQWPGLLLSVQASLRL